MMAYEGTSRWRWSQNLAWDVPVYSCSVPARCISNDLSERQLQPQWLYLVVTEGVTSHMA
jgi:hypothetical protein